MNDDNQNTNNTDKDVKSVQDTVEDTAPVAEEALKDMDSGSEAGMTENGQDNKTAENQEESEQTVEESAPNESEPEETTPEAGEPEQAQEEAPIEEASENVEPEEVESEDDQPLADEEVPDDIPGARWYVVHTYSGHENRVAEAIKQRVESEHLEQKIIDVLVPTQEKIEIRGGKKENVKEKIFPGYILVKMVLDDISWLAVRTTQGVTSFIGMSNKPTPISNSEVQSIVKFMKQGGQPTYKQIFSEGDTVKIVDGPFADFIGKIDSVDKERGKIKVLVSIFGRETPVELDFLQVAKL